MSLFYNITGSTGVTVELIAPNEVNDILSILLTNVHATADATVTFTNAMGNQNYTPVSSTADGDICGTQADRTDGNGSRATTTFASRIRDNGGTARDAIACVALFGDLA